MKRLLITSLALLLTVPALAAPRAPRQYKSGNELEAVQLPSEPGRLRRMIAKYNAQLEGPGAQALTDVRSARLLLVPAAGNVKGAGGEFFRTDLTLVSYNETAAQRVLVVWLANGANTDDPPFTFLTLQPNTYYTFTDFVGATLQQLGQLGSILIIPVDSLGDIEFADAALDGYSRIWTNQPNATGTVAQPFEAVDPYSMFAFKTAAVLGLRHDAQYRSNFGIVNVDDVEHTFTVRFLGTQAQTERTFTIPAGGMIHQAVPAASYGSLVIEVDVDDETAPWVAYGTSNDNITGDGWVSIGSGVLTPEDLDDVDGGF